MRAFARRVLTTVAVGCAAVPLAGCGAPAPDAPRAPSQQRTWAQQNSGVPPAVDPQVPGQAPPSQGVPSAPGKPGSQQDANVVADHLDAPWGLTMLPNGDALVGERPTGRILEVSPKAAPPRFVMRIPGIDAHGDGGLLGLAIGPTFGQDGLVYAYITTAQDNRVLRFAIGQKPKAILTGIPKGATRNGGRIAFGPDGFLYVGTGDGGRPSVAAKPRGLAGKILRIDVFGKPAKRNPTPGSAVYARGLGDVEGLCWSRTRQLYAVDTDRVDTVTVDTVTGGAAVSVKPLYRWPAGNPAGPGSCAVEGFGLFVPQLAGERIDGIALGTTATVNRPPTQLFTRAYGRLRSIVAASDGALWITTSNRDGHGTPRPGDDRVLRIFPPSSSTTPPV